MTNPTSAGWEWPGGTIVAKRHRSSISDYGTVHFLEHQPERMLTEDAVQYRDAITAALDWLGALPGPDEDQDEDEPSRCDWFDVRPASKWRCGAPAGHPGPHAWQPVPLTL